MDKKEVLVNRPINLIGNWIIDSIYEGDIKLSSFDDEKNQGLEFSANGNLFTIQAIGHGVGKKQIGTYRFDKDSVWFVTPKGNVFQAYSFLFVNDSILCLKANVTVKSNVKPTIYLTKKNKW